LKEPLESFQCPVTRDYNGNSLQYRLMLLEVAESNGESRKPPHQFTYFTGTQAGASLPYRVPNWMETVVSAQSKGYYSQDHWGYFNGRENVDTLVPGQQYSGTLEPGQGSPLPDGSSWLSGADRSPVLEFAQLGSLAKITYPTGGNTTFEWALHTFVPPPASDANSISLTASVLRHWSWYTSPPGPENKPLPIIINNSDAKSGGTSVKIAISSYFPCACPSSNGGGAATESCNPSIHVWFIIREKATNKARFTFSVNYLDQPQPPKFEVFLENGEYYLDHHFENGWPGRDGKPQTEPDPARPYGLTLEWPEATEVSGGGLRVAQITDYDPVARQRLVKQYEYKLTNGSTSGTLVSFPQYGYHYQEHISAQGESCTGIPEASAELDNKYFVRSSTSTAPLGVTQGGPVGYSKVTVYHAVQGEALGSRGKTEYTYTSPADYKDETPRTPSFPFAPANSRDWQRGLLTSQTDYRRAGTDYVPVKSLTNEYTFYKETDSANPNVAGRGALGIKVGYDYQWVTTNCGAQPFSFSPVNVTTFPPVAQYFNTSSGYALLTHAATAVYDPQDATRQTRTDNRYRYGLTHLELTEDARLASTGDSLKTTYRYPDDIAVGNGSAQQPAVAALQQLQTAHIANAVVEKREWLNKKGTTDWKLLAGTLTTFRNLAADPAAPNATIVVPAETQAIATAIPLASPTPTEAATGSLTFDAHYQVRDKFDAYTPTGQLLQRTRVPQQATTYLWGYGQQYPVAEIKNATYAEVLAVLGQPVVEQLAGTAPGTDAQVRQALQPLRTRLKNAQVSTFTYAPLVGMTSQTDPSGRTTTYEYDELGRLVRARDEHDRILSQQRYQYARP
jgi:YD repeat-containing protein